MQQDVTEITDFYDTPAGIMVRRIVSRVIRSRWPSVAGQSVIGLGYAVPYLSAFREEARSVAALMPAEQGVRRWPRAMRNRTALVEEDQLPLADGSVDRVLAVHAIEAASDIRSVLREIWRVLTPEGRVLIVVPNRRGLWAQSDSTPFGHGRPYSRGQLERLLDGAMLSVESIGHALAVPPIGLRAVQRSASGIERIGIRLWPAFSGVVVVEASKRMVGGLAVPVRGRRVRIRALAPAAAGRASVHPAPGRLRQRQGLCLIRSA
ncbi:MAG: methyltransferase domain-containing protein [Hyphomicrobiaceae bacterium]